MSHFNPLTGGSVQLIVESRLSPLQTLEEPRYLLKALQGAVRAGRRRGFGRRGTCLECGRRLALHFGELNEKLPCKGRG